MYTITILSLFAIAHTCTAQYDLQSNFTGPTFFDNFNFSTLWDHSFGYVEYVDRPTAEAMQLINASNPHGPAIFGVEHVKVLDPGANLGRASLRLVSEQTWQHGLFIVDLAHMPDTTCGLWPAMWLVGNGVDVWPANGEIDIIEYLNLRSTNTMGLHTLPGCTVAGAGQRGTLLTNDCGADAGFAGCLMSPSAGNNVGTSFNDIGGGVYAMEWTSTAIRIWFFPRGAIPADVTSTHPNPLNWGLPDGNWEGGCNIDAYFSNMSLVFNTDFCGSWAGPTFVQDGCSALNVTNAWSSCNEYVALNPAAFIDAYWAINYIQVFQTQAGTPPPSSSILSSVTPVASTSEVSSGAPEGASTTSSPPSTTVQSTSLPVSSSTSMTVQSTSLPVSSSSTSPPNSTVEPSDVAVTTIVVTTVITIIPTDRAEPVRSTIKLATIITSAIETDAYGVGG